MSLELAIFAIVIILLAIAIAIFFIWKKHSGGAECSKRLENGMSIVTIKPHRDLDLVIVEDAADKEKLVFQRADVKNGEEVVFTYPASVKSAVVSLRYNNQEKKIEVGIL